ncbi:MAG: phosphatidate cytidylyltransferase [Saprospiraceae bacterium]|nr:phosphatidate cytidylyltransferase [Saprospiraceae bacterium]
MAEGLKQRVLTAIAFGIPFLAAMFYSDLSRIVLLAIICLGSAIEYGRLQSEKWQSKLIHHLSIGFIVLMVFAATANYHPIDTITWNFELFHTIILFAGLIINCIFIIDLFTGIFPVHKKAPWLANIIYASLSYSVLMTTEPKLLAMIFISMIILIWVSDSSAYFVGKSIGKHKLMPRISPGKTWEGFLGAGMITLIVGYIISNIYTQYPMQSWILIALFVWLFGSVGDLVESKFKRSIEIKDSGTLLPGHGGLLDRFDGFFFSIPFVVFLIEKILS